MLANHARCAVLAAALFALPVDGAQAGFFDFLFNPPPPAAPSPPPGYYSGGARPRAHSHPYPVFHARRPKPEVAVALHHHHKVTAEKTRHAAASHAAMPPRAAPGLMEDDSLEDGDAVMTDRGIRIFTGDSDSHHKPEEFTKLSETKGLSKHARAALAEIDANRSEGGGRALRDEFNVMTGRSAAESDASAGAVITDPRGRKIRYVGP